MGCDRHCSSQGRRCGVDTWPELLRGLSWIPTRSCPWRSRGLRPHGHESMLKKAEGRESPTSPEPGCCVSHAPRPGVIPLSRKPGSGFEHGAGGPPRPPPRGRRAAPVRPSAVATATTLQSRELRPFHLGFQSGRYRRPPTYTMMRASLKAKLADAGRQKLCFHPARFSGRGSPWERTVIKWGSDTDCPHYCRRQDLGV